MLQVGLVMGSIVLVYVKSSGSANNSDVSYVNSLLGSLVVGAGLLYDCEEVVSTTFRFSSCLKTQLAMSC